MIVPAYIFAGLSLLLSLVLLNHNKYPWAIGLLLLKLLAGALSPLWAITGAAGAIIGWVYQAYWAIPMGLVGSGMMILYVWRCARNHKGFEAAFGTGWSDLITSQQARYMIQKRWSPFLKMKISPEPSFERDIAFWTVPGTDRHILCDIWQPDNGSVSGLAFIYLHGGGWSIGDKDFLTRPFFRHLVSQGHTVMDVSYRLIPETDIYGVVADVKRAIAWLKTNASHYGLNPEKIVVGGGSGGGHLALLAGYLPEHPALTPEDLKGADLSVRGVISFYGPADMAALYQYMKTEGLPPVSIGPDSSLENQRDAGRLDMVLGGHLRELPDIYQLFSPTTHVHPDCPPTLLIQGEHDYATPASSTKALYTRLVESGVPTVNIVLPWTEHGFDLLLPQISPPAQSALYDVDRFLAILVNHSS